MKFKKFTLDKFQEDAIRSIENNHSVVVSAATGTGKTLIADYVIDKAIRKGKRVFYTAPIKALSNQKYRDFKSDYGEEKVGIMTGDVVINPSAQIIVMTTEIYRNMLVVKDSATEDLTYVVFDEIHFINDIERGTVWEESIIFSGLDVRFLCLSATIPNAQEFADWIMSIQGHQVDVVEYSKRAVPLKHLVYERHVGLTTAKKLKENMKLDLYPEYHRSFRRRKKIRLPSPAQHYDLVKELASKDQMPIIFFVFSRKACETKAKELYRMQDFTTKKEKAEIARIYSERITKEIRPMESAQFLRQIITKGIAVHHAGILPLLKEIVEILFSKGLIKVLYATETFAVGINMPAKTVCFNTLEKYDGISFRYLNSKEYFQMAGRAGRRGIDKEGRAISLIDRNHTDIDKVIRITTKDVEPIRSQFKLSINSVINLVNNYPPADIERILKSSFDYFQRKKENKNIRIMASYNNKIRFLRKMGYIDDEGLTDKGRFIKHIYAHEILFGEIFMGGMHKMLNDDELMVLVGAVIYEPRRNDRFKRADVYKRFSRIMDAVSTSQYVYKNIQRSSIRKILKIVTMWYEGCEFEELMGFTSLEEGDLIRFFRQIIDYLRQIRRASEEYELKERMDNMIRTIDRDLIKVEF